MQDYVEILKFNDNLQLGQKVLVRWTNSYRYFHGKATIVKLNSKSVRATLEDDIILGSMVYPKGQSIVVPRVGSDKWTWNNGVFPRE